MNRPSDLGINRTGASLSPLEAAKTAEGAQAGGYGEPDLSVANDLRRPYVQEGRLLGSMPPPTTVKGAAATALKKMRGESVGALLDVLGARLAFERTGVRLYEALIRKVEMNGASLPVARLRHIHDEELRHFHLVHKVVVDLGGDPTVLTPDADVSAVIGKGVADVVLDPRTSVAQSLDAILVAERADAGCWELLVEACDALDRDDLVEQFGECLANEERHVEEIREMYASQLYAKLGVKAPKVH